MQSNQDTRPQNLLVFKALTCIDPTCGTCGANLTRPCCLNCQLERTIIVWPLEGSECWVARAFCRTVCLRIVRTGFYVESPRVYYKNQNYPFNLEALEFFNRALTEPPPDGAAVGGTAPDIPLQRQVDRLVDMVEKYPRSKIVGMLIFPIVN